MKPINVFTRQCVPAVTGFLLSLIISPGFAAEVASPANRFPSPTGLYNATSSAPIAFPNGVVCHTTHLRMASSSVPLPTTGALLTHTFECKLDVGISSDGGTTFNWATFPSSVVVRMTPSADGLPGSFDTEMLSLSLNGAGLPAGMMIRESPTLQSTGHHTVRQVPSGTFHVDSFFDVFVELSMDGGQAWLPAAAAHQMALGEPDMAASPTEDLPPVSAVTGELADISFPNLVVVRGLALESSAVITTLPSHGVLYQYSDSGRAKGDISLDGGATFAPFECDYTGSRRLTGLAASDDVRFFDTEMLSMVMSGGTLPPNLRIRESPSKASLGRLSMRTQKGAVFRSSGFFDIFTEVSLTNGASWTAADGEPVQAYFNPKEISVDKVRSPSNLFPPPMAVFKSVGGLSNETEIVEYQNGTIARGLQVSLSNASLTPPALGEPPQTQTVDCTVQMELSSDGGETFEPLRLPGMVTLRISATGGGGGGGTGGLVQTFDTEMLALNVSGSTFMLRESPSKASLGKHTVRAVPDGSSFISSFFDVFTELSLDGGATWSSAPDMRCMMKAELSDFPRPSPNFPPDETVLACKSDETCGNGVVIRRFKVHGLHHGTPPPTLGVTQLHVFDGSASGEISLDGGATFAGWTGACTGTCQLTSYLDDGGARYFDTEMLALNLSGGTLPETFMLRESPTRASIGRTSIRQSSNGQYGMESFFDVFTEMSLDSGATWTPAGGNPSVFGFDPVPIASFYATENLPLPGDYESAPNAAPVTFPNGVVLSRLRKRPELLFQAWENASKLNLQPLGGDVVIHASVDGGANFEEIKAHYDYTVSVSSKSSSNGTDTEQGMEIHSLTCTLVTGGTTIMIRESPTLPSLGKTNKRACLFNLGLKGRTAGFMVSSFFDIFTEVSIDGGNTWVPGSGPLHASLLPYVEQDNVFRADFFPPREGSFESHPNAQPASFGSSALIQNMRVRIDALETRLKGLGLLGITAPQTVTLPCVLEGELSQDGGLTWIPVSAPADSSLRVQKSSSITGSFDTEMLALNISGGTLPAGVMLRESPTRASTGRTQLTSRLMEHEGIFHKIDSFFDVFTELSIDGGANWTPADEACRLELHADTTGVFNPSKWQPVVAMHLASDPGYTLSFEDTDVQISGLWIDSPQPSDITPGGTAPPPAPGATVGRQCTCPMGYHVKTSAAAPAQRSSVKFGYIYWTAGNVRSVPGGTVVETEVTGLNISGGTMPPGMILRESPTRASLGTYFENGDIPSQGGRRINSFFDIFTELSLDGGQTWHAARSPLHMETVDASTTKRFGIGNNEPLPPTTFKASPGDSAPRTASGDRPSSVQFATLIDSAVNLIDDRHLLGLRTYDTLMSYSTGDSVVYNNYICQTHFGYAISQLDDLADGTVHRIEVTQCDMQGGTLPTGTLLRESPTRQSMGRIVNSPQSDGTFRVLSFFDVFLEISKDNGGTWEPFDQALHFEMEDLLVTSIATSDTFPPPGTYAQRGTPVRCPDGTCADISLAFTSPPAAVPTGTTPSVYPLNGNVACVANGASSVCPASAQVSLTLTHTIGGTRYFDTEMLSLNLSGGTLPGGFLLRESPTRRSLGQQVIASTADGQFRISSFFDIFTEISLDGGQTWSESESTTRLELSGPEIVVEQPSGVELTDGNSSLDFGVVLAGSTATRPIVIGNIGTDNLAGLSFSITGPNSSDFSIPPPSSAPMSPGMKTSFAILLNAGGSGNCDATLHITSNDSDENTYDIQLTARVLTPNADDDGDGLTNAQEIHLSSNPLFSQPSEAFNPLFDSSSDITFLRDNGLYRTSDVQALNVDVPLLTRNPATGEFKLTFGLEKSTNLTNFAPFPMSAPQSTINTQGKLEYLFTSPDSASFYRVQAK